MVWANPCTNCSVVPCGPPSASSVAKIWKSRCCNDIFKCFIEDTWVMLRHQNVKRIQELFISLQEIHSLPSCWHCRPGIAFTALTQWPPATIPGRNALPGSSSHLPHNKTAGKKFSARGELQLACPSAEFCWPQPQLVQMPGMDVSAQKPILTNTAQKCAKAQGCLESQK